MKYAAFAAALALAACQPAAEKPAEPAAPAPEAAPAAAAVTPAKPSGPPQTVAAEAESESLSGAVSVTDIHFVKDADLKLFSTAGGDPAINGLYTYIARWVDEDRSWSQIFMIGDFNSWEVVEESPTRVVLKVSRSWVEQSTGDIKTADEKLILDVPQDAAAPLTVTPAT